MLPFEKNKRDVIVIRDAEAGYPIERPAEELINSGVVNIDKPKGPTSHEVSAFVQKILGIKKSGHSGSLDPAVTGVLPIALGSSTRIVQTLLKSGKEYVCIMHLHKEVKEQQIKKALKQFKGTIKQKPPIKSAVKRVERYREIYYLEVLEIDGKDVLFRVGCEAGTYIRKLCWQIGERLGVGAHMAELRRTKAGPFDESTTITLQDLTDASWYWKNEQKEEYLRKCIQPIEAAVAHLPKIWVLDSTVDSLCHGISLKIPGISKINSGIEPDQKVAVMNLKDELIGIGPAMLTSQKMVDQEKGIAVKMDKVFMKSVNNKEI